MVDPDQTHDSPYIAQFVEESVPRGEPVAIAFVFNYHLARELFFRSGGRAYVTMPLWQLVDATGITRRSAGLSLGRHARLRRRPLRERASSSPTSTASR